MQPLFTFNVVPTLPAELEPLREMACNLWWTWEPAARKLFRDVDVDLWHQTNHNPLRVLQLCRQARLHELALDKVFLGEVETVYGQFQAYLSRKDTYGSGRDNALIAYFSAEFGFHESFPNYSGGLGILSGDHCKAASDLGLNFIGVTLLYRHGYFKQEINRDGWQESIRLNQNFHHLPIREVRDEQGETLLVCVDILGRRVCAKVWQMKVGRITLYLLDTDISANSSEDRAITAQLYGGDLEMRIKQEILLGIGGVQALNLIGLQPAVYHMNEGHSAFLSLELIRREVEEHGLDYHAALQLVAAANIFTTHTPVPAGNDAFPRDLMQRYFRDFPGKLGIGFDEFFALGQSTVASEPTFSMTILALRTSRHSNGVSRLHGEVSRGLWKDVWAGIPENEVPITSITNGIHTKTWLSPEFSALYDRYLPNWQESLTDVEFWRGVIDIPDDVLWETHHGLKERLVEFVRERVRLQRVRNGESPEKIRQVGEILNPEILTIGFARRFATYKRGTLLFSDLDRLKRMLNHPERPVQFIFAGKAHPQDEGGKRLIQEVYRWSRAEGLENRIVFIEDYDAYIGRRLTQGVDLWLNNPLRPLEASGTSGMKLPPNGGLNLSVLDGWWCEGYNGKNGWAVGAEIVDGSVEFQNEVDTASLFHVLENQIIPLYYAKPDGRLPLAWLQLMRESIRSVTPVFNTQRMVSEYNELLYEPAAAAHTRLGADSAAKARELARWKEEIRRLWPQVRVPAAEVRIANEEKVNVVVGDELTVEALVFLGEVKPGSVRVQAYAGECHDNLITDPVTVDLAEAGGATRSDGCYLYRGSIPASESGAYGLNVRVIPHNPLLTQGHELQLITWAQ
ncbi:MAG TPA: alpha-glucan family phosphorylase [Chthoniobacteraceae bacterium]|nr:alpha-glucan family phosphorylase [Chthoniobacteraceae bacterium]